MPKKNRIEDLRDHLFETIEALKDEHNPMDIERAKAVGKIADTIIDSAKVEVDFLRVTGGFSGSGFIPEELGQGERKPQPRRITAAGAPKV